MSGAVIYLAEVLFTYCYLTAIIIIFLTWPDKIEVTCFCALTTNLKHVSSVSGKQSLSVMQSTSG